jgi:hypothetical protein
VATPATDEAATNMLHSNTNGSQANAAGLQQQ